MRRICALPNCTRFGPHNQTMQEPVVMTVDEYETIRLIDLEDLTQEQCAQQMEVARTTVQAMYAAARKKLAECLVQEKNLRIEGGEYQLCEHLTEPCGRGCRRRHGRQQGCQRAHENVEPLERSHNK